TTLTFAVATALPAPATAGIHADDLSRCLVAKTSDAERIALAKWIFTVISVHPEAASLATIDASTMAGISRDTAGIFQTLLTESCRDETALAVKYEGTGALGESFKVLGEIAMSTLLADSRVATQLQEFI